MGIKTEIFKSYDIRGVYPRQIDKKSCFLIGRAYLDFIKKFSEKPKIVIGRDARPSSPDLFKGLTAGIKKEGGRVIDIGEVTTPMLYFGVNYLKADGGIMITASHNPSPYNGLKMTREKAIPISGETGLQEIKEKALSFKEAKIKEVKVKKQDISKDYISFLTKDKEIDLEGKIGVDCGNGMTGPILRGVFQKLKVNFIPLYFKPDCTFPNHEANPFKEETLNDLKKVIKKEKAILGVAFDGDGDRVVFLDHKAEVIRGDFITSLLAKEILKEKSGKVLYDLRSLWTPREVIKEAGGIPIMSRVGHSLIKEQMRKEKAVFAGEMSGHYFFRDFFGCESGILTMIKILEIVTKEGKSLRELVGEFKKYFHSGEINFKVEDKEKVIKKLEKKYSQGKISHLDGLTVEFDKWWFNVRPSNTEPLLRLNLEAKSKNLMKKKVKEIKNFITNS